MTRFEARLHAVFADVLTETDQSSSQSFGRPATLSLAGNMGYVDPDGIYRLAIQRATAAGRLDQDYHADSVVFIYGKNGRLVYGGPTHADIIERNPSMVAGLGLSSGRVSRIRDRIEAVALLGRIGDAKVKIGFGPEATRRTCAFWNKDPGIYDDLLDDCLDDLDRDGKLTPDTIISTPFKRCYWARYERGNPTDRTMSDADREKLELQRKLHLMRPDDKKEAMAKLGLAQGNRKRDIQAAAEQHGLVQPGQKWWAMHSESRSADIGRFRQVMANCFDGDSSAQSFVAIPNGDILYDSGVDGHTGIALSNVDRLPINWQRLIDDDQSAVVDFVHDECLCGRIDHQTATVAIWGANVGRPTSNISTVMRRLMADNAIGADWQVVMSTGDVYDVADVVANGLRPEPTDRPADTSIIDLYQRLHLLPPDQKRTAMAELGLSQGSRKSNMQAAAEKHGIINPSQKWWAMHSESRRR